MFVFAISNFLTGNLFMDTQGMAAVIGVCPSPAQFRENNTEKQEPDLTPHLQGLKDDLTTDQPAQKASYFN